ncbi:MAG: cation diffusion facilitator family transporter [Pseudomonadota bacterium]|nr:cation diffusion facilitator family transporter [Pseudomonadota bacterium]
MNAPAPVSLDRDTTQAQHHVGHDHGGDALFKALFFTLAFAVVEVVAGFWSGSLALLSDAGHMVTDSTALGLAALAAWLAHKPPSNTHTYGLVRLEILAALFNSLLMLGLIVFIVVEAIDRLANPQPVMGGAVMGVAFIGLLVNLAVAWLLHHGGDGLNTRAAFLHVLGDLLGSVAALVAGAVIWATGYMPIDPILSLVVSGLILVSAWRLLTESLHVLMEGVPTQVSLEKVALDLGEIPGVRRVHDLHVWTLSSGQIALSAHLELDSFGDWDRILRASRACLDQDHSIRHVTLQAELGHPKLGHT